MNGQLTAREEEWFLDLRDKLSRFDGEAPFEQREARLDDMRHVAEQLTTSLAGRGIADFHSAQLTANRSTDNKDSFYHNYHALQDLVAYCITMYVPGMRDT